MSASITNAFISQYTNEVKQLFQQKGSKLMDKARVHRNVVGSTYDFHTLAAVEANTKSRSADVTGLDPTSAKVTATMADYFAPIYIDKLDELKTNANLRMEYATASTNAIGRKCDDIMITALAAGSIVAPTVAGGLTYAKLLEALTLLNAAEVDPEKRVLVVGAKQMSDALGLDQLTSQDYVQVSNIMNAGVGSALGFAWVMSTRLPLAVANRTCFAYNMDSLGLAIGQDITTEINYIPEKVSFLTNSFVSLGSVIVDTAGVVEITCVE